MFNKNAKNIFNLEYGDYIIIEKNKYSILSMIKFIEGSSYWIEYKLYDELLEVRRKIMRDQSINNIKK